MHTPSLLLATVACLSTFVSAEPERPKFYFPRQIKRQVWNNLTGPLTTPARSPSLSIADSVSSLFSSTKRQDPNVSGNGIFPNSGASGTGVSSGSAPSDTVQTVTIESTTVVIDSTQPPATTAPVTDTSGTATTSIDSAITFGPSGIITASTAAAPDLDAQSTIDVSAPPSSSGVDTPAPTDGIVGPGTSIVPSPAPTTTQDVVPSPAPTASQDVVPSPAPTTSQDVVPSPAPTTSQDVVPSPAPTASQDVVPSPAPTTIQDIVPSPAPTTTQDIIPSPTPTASQDVVPSPTPSTTQDIVPSPAPMTTQDVVPSPAPTTTQDVVPSPAPTTIQDIVPSPAPSTTQDVVPSFAPSTTQDVVSDITPAPAPASSDMGPTTVPAPVSTNTDVIPLITSSDLDVPSTQVPVTPTGADTLGISGVPTGVSDTAVATPAPITTAASDNTSIALPAPTSDVGVGGPTATSAGDITTGAPGSDSSTIMETAPATSIPPAASDGTTGWLPPVIATQSLPTASDATATTATGIPSTLPVALTPPTGLPERPVDTIMIQIGFKYALNYAFVASNSNSSAQIFTFLPKGLAYGLSIKEEQVTMNSLNPYDTLNTLGYITTLATAYIPSTMVSTLQAELHQPLSLLYGNQDQSVHTLMSYINPAIPLIPGSQIADGTATAAIAGATTSATSGGSGSNWGGTGLFNTDSQNSSWTTKSQVAGIAGGVVLAATAYGAAMFLIARRYKKRRSSHRRSSSVASPPQMRFPGSPALMGGVLMSGGRGTPGMQNGRESRGSGRSGGNSARTVEISAPMMAENSLGWN